MNRTETGTGAAPVLVVSVHDVAPASAAATRRWVELLAPLGVPLTFLLIPGPWQGRDFGQPADDGADLPLWLRERQARGDEMSLHGWCHRADVPGPLPRRLVGNVVARGAAEFWALDRAEAYRRAARGRQVLEDHGLYVTGTTPPGWLAGRAAVAGLAAAGLGYTTDHTGLVDLTTGRRFTAAALCHRPGPANARHAPLGEVAGRQVLSSAWRFSALRRPVRIGLHPADLDRPGLPETTVRAVRRCLEAGAEAVTYREVARRLRSTGITTSS